MSVARRAVSLRGVLRGGGTLALWVVEAVLMHSLVLLLLLGVEIYTALQLLLWKLGTEVLFGTLSNVGSRQCKMAVVALR